MAGLLVVLEGMDFCGKSTQREKVATMLENLGHEVVRTREVGGTPAAEQLRELYLQKIFTPKAELLVIQAARADHIENVIRPAVKAGKIVICDRFFLSTYAWQVHPYINEEDSDLLGLFGETLQLIIKDIGPTVQFYLDVPKDVRIARREQLGDRDPFEDKPEEFRAKVEEAYQLIAEQGDAVRVNADIDEDLLTVELVKLIEQAKEEAAALPDQHPLQPAEGAEGEAPAEGAEAAAEEELPPIREFTEHSISTHFQNLIALLPENVLKRWRDIALDKSEHLIKELVEKGQQGKALYQQIDHGMRYIAQMAYNHEAANQLLTAHAKTNNLRPLNAARPNARQTKKKAGKR